MEDHVNIDGDTLQNKLNSGIIPFYNDIKNFGDQYSKGKGTSVSYEESVNTTNADADVQGNEDFYGNNTYGESI